LLVATQDSNLLAWFPYFM